MAIPKQVQKQSEAVQELYKELKEEEVNENQEAPQQEAEAPETVPAADSVEEVAVEELGALSAVLALREHARVVLLAPLLARGR